MTRPSSPGKRTSCASQLSPNLLSQSVINLTAFPPTLSYKTAKPPLYSAEGGVSHNGLICYGVGDGNASYIVRPGVSNLNASSGSSELSLNNYFGWNFNGINDLIVDPVNGDIRFTDNDAV